MPASNPSFFARLLLAFRVLLSPKLGAAVSQVTSGGELALPKPEPEPEPPPLTEAPPDAALQLLGLLQREGRFVDFLEEDVRSFSDEEIGAAARVVHEGCKKALREHFDMAPIRSEEEGSKIELPAGFDAREVRLVGNVVGEPPFVGTLQHRGWRVTRVELPKIAEEHDVSILAPAEVEL